MFVVCCVLVAMATHVYGIFNSIRIALKVAAASESYKSVHKELSDSACVLLNAKLWVPQHPYVCITLLRGKHMQ